MTLHNLTSGSPIIGLDAASSVLATQESSVLATARNQLCSLLFDPSKGFDTKALDAAMASRLLADHPELIQSETEKDLTMHQISQGLIEMMIQGRHPELSSLIDGARRDDTLNSLIKDALNLERVKKTAEFTVLSQLSTPDFSKELASLIDKLYPIEPGLERAGVDALKAALANGLILICNHRSKETQSADLKSLESAIKNYPEACGLMFCKEVAPIFADWINYYLPNKAPPIFESIFLDKTPQQLDQVMPHVCRHLHVLIEKLDAPNLFLAFGNNPYLKTALDSTLTGAQFLDALSTKVLDRAIALDNFLAQEEMSIETGKSDTFRVALNLQRSLVTEFKLQNRIQNDARASLKTSALQLSGMYFRELLCNPKI